MWRLCLFSLSSGDDEQTNCWLWEGEERRGEDLNISRSLITFLSAHQARPGSQMAKQSFLSVVRKEDHQTEFREAFNAFDWNHSGKISYGSLQVSILPPSLATNDMICHNCHKKWIDKISVMSSHYIPTVWLKDSSTIIL